MMPNLLVVSVVILVILAGLLVFKKFSKPSSSAALPYQAKTALCSPAERSLLGVLDQLLGDQNRIAIKVRLADLLEIQKGVSKSLRQNAFNRISRKHVDFVVCDKNELSILGVIELDDQSHQSARRRQRDSFLDTALNAVGIPVLHIQAQNTYSVIEILQQLQNSFTFLTDKAEPESPRPAGDSIDHEKIQPHSEDDTENLEICADCGAPMVKRQATKGKLAGKYFLACSNFPKCRNIVPIKQSTT
jgi:very-short-patch-repair endonuclease